MRPLIPNNSYPVFNHANGFENVFREDENYRYFLEKYKVYITPVVETYAYCLLPNHFHLVVRIRKREVIEELIRNKNNATSIITSPNRITTPAYQPLEKL
jgi:REP element-mobilizing transposase RayT